jgi:hypothetical protein
MTWFDPHATTTERLSSGSGSSNFGSEAEVNPVNQIFTESWDQWDDGKVCRHACLQPLAERDVDWQEDYIEQLAGFDYIIDRSVFEHGELNYARNRLEEWLDRQAIEVPLLAAARLSANVITAAGERERRAEREVGRVHRLRPAIRRG